MPNSMAKKQGPPRRHHYVPQFYLKHFTMPPEHKYVASLKKSDGLSFSGASTKNVGLEIDFYTINGDPKFEDELKVLESEWSALHNLLVTEKNADALSETERKKYAEFIGFQLSRTVQFRNWLTNAVKLAFSPFIADEPGEEQRKAIRSTTGIMVHALNAINVEKLVDESMWNEVVQKQNKSKAEIIEMVEDIIKGHRNELEEASKTGVLPSDFRSDKKRIDERLAVVTKKKHVEGMAEFAEDKANRIEKMRWVVIENSTSVPLITSDNPVCITIPQVFQKSKEKSDKKRLRWVLDVMGLAEWDLPDGKPNSQIMVNFPLSPKLLLVAAQKKSDEGVTKYLQAENQGFSASVQRLWTARFSLHYSSFSSWLYLQANLQVSQRLNLLTTWQFFRQENSFLAVVTISAMSKQLIPQMS